MAPSVLDTSCSWAPLGRSWPARLRLLNKGGIALAAAMALFSAPIEFLLAYFFRFRRKILTPAVGGVVTMLIAVSILPIALNLWVGQPGTPGAGSTTNLLVGLTTFVTILGCSILGGRVFRQWGRLLGLAVGYVVAAVFTEL